MPFPSVLAKESTGDIVAQSAGRVLATEMENARDTSRQQEQKTSQVMSCRLQSDNKMQLDDHKIKALFLQMKKPMPLRLVR